ncbi:MAG: hypothetical protein J3K34DRAFT_408553 [Monoraphidium minutum]|nr:MAG: hypothetical protein J3K34DRAFT_408553 [Monoraphidium minutum]
MLHHAIASLPSASAITAITALVCWGLLWPFPAGAFILSSLLKNPLFSCNLLAHALPRFWGSALARPCNRTPFLFSPNSALSQNCP